jgi:hypothetical protein
MLNHVRGATSYENLSVLRMRHLGRHVRL